MVLVNFMWRYFWVIAIVVAALNTAIMWWRSQRHIRANPSLAAGYAFLLRGYWLWLTLPWVVMGIGILWGNVPTVWHFLFPSTGNPYVLAWWIVYWLLNGIFGYWLLFGGGAAMLVAHPGFLRGNPQNPQLLKLWGVLILAGSAAVTIIMFAQPAPEIPEMMGYLGAWSPA